MLNKALDFVRTYAKAMVAAGGLLAMVGDGIATGHFNGPKAFDLAVALVTALAVHRVPNKPVVHKVVVSHDTTPPAA